MLYTPLRGWMGCCHPSIGPRPYPMLFDPCRGLSPHPHKKRADQHPCQSAPPDSKLSILNCHFFNFQFRIILHQHRRYHRHRHRYYRRQAPYFRHSPNPYFRFPSPSHPPPAPPPESPSPVQFEAADTPPGH